MSIFDKLNLKKSSGNDVSDNVTAQSILGREADTSGSTVSDIDDDLPSVNRRSKSGNLVSLIGTMAVAGAGAMMLYYINAGEAPKAEKPKSQVISNHLPPLEIPDISAPERPPEPIAAVPAIKAEQAQIPVQQPVQGANNQPPKPTWLDRRMGGNLVINGGSSGAASTGSAAEKQQLNTQQIDSPTPLALKLKPTVSPGVSASLLPNRNFIIAKGASLDCALETAIDSTLPGITTCRLTRDIYSDNGHVVLLDRGSQLVGEYQGGLTAGQARIFVVWSRVKTPNGVVISLDSPGADTLGRAGHSGWVDTHFPERFGAAVLLSLVKDALAIARSKNGNGQLQIGGGGSDQLATEVLKNTINIPPTLYVNQGDHIQIMVARDLDFSTVYGLDLKE
ncbi:type IV secretion system protein VirB10 [Methylotenera sp. G11]|uniref:type IV secretion system protein VirB10 n=1 Tax=Methylotenera sp. G11 TaxID=1506585 RepID=UPI000645AE36|nr:type IV secretion system protein VirB10 [Methylotenera sp. G11]